MRRRGGPPAFRGREPRRDEREPMRDERGPAFRGARGRGGFRGGAAMNTASMRTNLSTKQTNSMKRLMKDYKEIRESDTPIFGVSATPLDEDFFRWHANLRGPEDTAFFGGTFHMEIQFPHNYPVSPPIIKLFTHIPHPNVFGNTLCLDMLQEKHAGAWYEKWNSGYTAESILIQL
jgi:ubiquitin-protein ligase